MDNDNKDNPKKAKLTLVHKEAEAVVDLASHRKGSSSTTRKGFKQWPPPKGEAKPTADTPKPDKEKVKEYVKGSGKNMTAPSEGYFLIHEDFLVHIHQMAKSLEALSHNFTVFKEVFQEEVATNSAIAMKVAEEQVKVAKRLAKLALVIEQRVGPLAP